MTRKKDLKKRHFFSVQPILTTPALALLTSLQCWCHIAHQYLHHNQIVSLPAVFFLSTERTQIVKTE